MSAYPQVLFKNRRSGETVQLPEYEKSGGYQGLRDALQLVDVRVLDHLILGDGEWCSFAERGLI